MWIWFQIMGNILENTPGSDCLFHFWNLHFFTSSCFWWSCHYIAKASRYNLTFSSVSFDIQQNTSGKSYSGIRFFCLTWNRTCRFWPTTSLTKTISYLLIYSRCFRFFSLSGRYSNKKKSVNCVVLSCEQKKKR